MKPDEKYVAICDKMKPLNSIYPSAEWDAAYDRGLKESDLPLFAKLALFSMKTQF